MAYKNYALRRAAQERNAPKRPCAYCGTAFPAVAKLRSTYCGYSCSAAAKHAIRNNGSCEWRCSVEWTQCVCGRPLTARGRRRLCSPKCSPAYYIPRPPKPYTCATCGLTKLGHGGRLYCSKACTPRYGPRGREVPPSVRLAIAERDEWLCQLCGRSIPNDVPPNHPDELTADHILPRSHGGPDDPINLRAAHRKCNTARGNRMDWAPTLAA